MGFTPPGMTLERIENDSGYEPRNCRWATRTEQARNTRVTKLNLEKARAIRNDTRKLLEVAKEYGVTKSVVSKIRLGKYWKELSTNQPTRST
jgi:hypothetical protein